MVNLSNQFICNSACLQVLRVGIAGDCWEEQVEEGERELVLRDSAECLGFTGFISNSNPLCILILMLERESKMMARVTALYA